LFFQPANHVVSLRRKYFPNRSRHTMRAIDVTNWIGV